MSPRRQRESRAVFEHIIGRQKRVVGFNAFGWPELSFRIRRGPYAGLHSVWIEPGLLRIGDPPASQRRRVNRLGETTGDDKNDA